MVICNNIWGKKKSVTRFEVYILLLFFSISIDLTIREMLMWHHNNRCQCLDKDLRHVDYRPQMERLREACPRRLTGRNAREICDMDMTP
jgi:hypothetical protein